MCRIGEAAVPGPTPKECIIGCINPTGILGKASSLTSLPQADHAVWAISETHLSKPGKTKFTQQLKFFKTGLHAQMGSSVPLRSHTVSAIAGKHRGVGFVCNTPSRAMTATWPHEAWQEGRFHVACFQMGERWVQGGVVYGLASHPQMAATKQYTDQQCQYLTERLIHQSQGLRFIAGDFNQPHGALPSMEKWIDAGWVNVQQWALQTLGRSVEFTCKQKTTIDHLYVSPQLAMYLKDVEVIHDLFADHSVVAAKFHSLGTPPMLPMWRKPAPIDWSHVDASAVAAKLQVPDYCSDHTEYYSTLCSQVEEAVDQAIRSKGKQPLPTQARGRGKTLEVKWVQEHTAPIKKAREGEHEPGFHGINQQHTRWTRQYRRLLNYVRLVQDFRERPTTVEHRLRLWQSIEQAAGFAPSFPAWFQLQAGLHQPLPSQPPAYEQAITICQTFHGFLTQFEKLLNTQRIHMAKQRRHDDPAIIFQDLRDEPPQPVQMLVDQRRTSIQEVDQDESAIITHQNTAWNLDQPIRSNGTQAQIIHAEERKIWLDHLEGFEVGHVVEQENYIGRLSDLFAKFHAEWNVRWDRHKNVDDDRWEPIIAFAKLALPSLPPMEYAPITQTEWVAALKKKSKKAATGPDGVSRQDLLNFPPAATQALLDMLTQIEAGQAWPRQLVVGMVTSLAKVPGAATTNQFRPITVLPVAFRTWGSIRAKQILRHLMPLVPSTCAGNVPGRQAADVWYQIMTAIEAAQYAQEPLSGGVVDLEKAFNMLPRLPILEFMAILNVAPPVLRAWATALVSLERRFTIHQCTGPPLKSTSGFAEGCGLSVTAMLAANLVAHQYLLRRYPQAMLWTFVDNWEITSKEARVVHQALEALHAFCSVMDMRIDEAKSYTWAVTADERRALRDHEYQVKLAAKDLGGHIQYSQIVTNSTITQRCAKLQTLWGRLARSLAPYRQKLQALRSKAWPAGLHGISSVHLGDEHYQKLRTGAMQGLGEHCPGASPLIHFSLIEPVATDPQLHALLTTVLMFRAMYPHPDVATFCLEELHLPKRVVVPRPGPVSVLLARLHQIGWTWDHAVSFRDHWNECIELDTCPIQELRARLTQGWQQRIQGQVSERKTMQGMQWMSPLLTMPTMKTLDPESQALLRTSLNGTFFTADRQRHYTKFKDSPDADACKFCGQKDSQLHRHWECPFFQHCRALSAEQIQTIVQMPPAVAAHGWMPEPPSLRIFQQLCLQIPDEHDQFVDPPELPEMLECFTDGACLAPTSPVGRLASWGVVLGDPAKETFHPISNGLVPGWTQTSLRGEAWAAVSAMQYAITRDRPIRIWCDNDQVVSRIRRFQTKSCKIGPNSANADLWRRVQSLVVHLGPNLQVVKISSHQDQSKAKDEGESWLFSGNEAADALAQHALFCHMAVFHAWQQLQHDVEAIHIMRNKVHASILSVAKEAVRNGSKEHQPVDKQHQSRISAAQVQTVSFTSFPNAEFAATYDCPAGRQIAAWLLTLEDERQPVRAISWFQLNILHEYQTGSKGVKYNKSKKQWEDGKQQTKAFDFVNRTRGFSSWIQGVARDKAIDCTPVHLRPQSEVLDFWTMCIQIKMKTELVELADSVLRNSANRIKTVKSLRSL